MAAVFVLWGCLMSHVMNTYARLPVAFSHGQGSRITDTEGKEYLDALSGIAVSTLGHAHPKLVAAIAAQAGRMLHTSNLYRIREQEMLAEALLRIEAMRRNGLAQRRQCGDAVHGQCRRRRAMSSAMSMAARRLVGSARPVPAMSSAVP